MTGRQHACRASIAAVFVLALLAGVRGKIFAADDGVDDPVLFRPPGGEAILALSRLEGESLVPVSAAWDRATGRARALEGRFPLDGADLRAACLELLAREPEIFGTGDGVELRLRSRHRGLGTEHLRFEAFTAGLPVAGSEVALHVDVRPGGPPAIVLVTSRLAPVPGLPAQPVPAVTAGLAARIAEDHASPGGLLGRATTSRLEVLPRPAGGRLVHAVWVGSLEPRGLFLVRVDAATGEVLSAGDLLRYAPPPARDGTGMVFLVNPIVAIRDRSLRDQGDSAAAVPPAAYSRVVLRELDGDGGLTGPYVTTAGTPHAARRVGLDFSFQRDFDGFEEVMIYHHVDAAQRFIQSLGFTDIYNAQIPVYANSEPPGIPYTDLQAYFLPDPGAGTGALAFGSGGVDLAEDAEVIIHEYGHAVQNSQVPGFGGNFDTLETFSIGEGWADWLAGSYLSAFSGGYGDACLGEWAAAGIPEIQGGETPECFRRLDSTKHYPEALVGEPHADGEMWSASLWRVFEALGREPAMRLVFQSNFFLSREPMFADAAAAVIRADRELNAGAHEDFLRRVFTERGFLAAPINLNWFYVSRLEPARPVIANDRFVAKLRLVRPGNIAAGVRDAIQVYVSFAHVDPGSLDFILRSPTGTSVTLHRAGRAPLRSGPVVYALTAPAFESLEAFAGEPISGVWSLEVNNPTIQEGKLSEWGLRFQGFVRGDANRDARIDISDAITTLQHLFLGGQMACPRAGDIDDGGALDISDPISLLNYLVGGGPPPRPPFPDPGEDLTGDDLPCGG